MKKILLILLSLNILALSLFATNKAKSLIRPKSIELEAAAKKWGNTPFSPSNFKTSDEKKRASMAVDLIRSKKYLGKPFIQVRQELGEWDGYFQTDSIPAYSIESARSGSKEAWLLVFLPDSSGKKVGEIKILKECCDD